jgi:hypothetical protein
MLADVRYVLVAVAFSCSRPAAPAQVTTPGLVEAAGSSTPVSTAPVGLATFEPPPAAAVAKNDRGVALLAKGQVEDAVKELEGALALAPDFTRARYNLACAEARAGRHDEAAEALAAAYEADFVAIRAHADQDDDLAQFWKSAPGIALAARKADYQARFARVIARGVHAILWKDGAGLRGALKPSVLRVGVYDPETARFASVAPPMKHSIFAYASASFPYAVVAEGDVHDQLGGDLDAGMSLDAVHVFPMSTDGVETTRFDVNAAPYSGTLSLGPTGITLRVRQSVPFEGTKEIYAAAWDARFFGAAGPVPRTLIALGDKEPPLAPDRTTHMTVGYNHWGYVVTEDNRAYSYKPHALAVPGGKTFDVPKALAFYQAPARVVASPSGDRVVLLWHAAVLTCDPKQDVPGRAKMALVDTKSGSVTTLGESDGAGAAAFDAAGNLFVQHGTRVEQMTAAGPKPLPERVLLVPPLSRDDQCGF